MRKQNDPKRTKIRDKKVKQPKKGLRIPRPMGLTLLARQTQTKQEINTELINKLLHYVFNNQLQINNKACTINELATYLNISNTTVMKAYIEYQNRLAKVMLGNSGGILGALQFLGLEKILENEALVSNQLRCLQASQGGEYKAYISSSVNEVLGLKMKSTDAILGLFKHLKPTGPTIAIQNNNGAQSSSAIKAIGMTEALQILDQQGLTNLSYNPQSYTHLHEAHNIGSGPEVRANHMALSATDGMSLLTSPKVQNKDEGHINRRAIEENLDTEEHLPS